jgi:TolB-like protein/Flp pilus assembly protein TadD
MRMGFVAELKRRNVIRMAGLYLVGAWLIVQVASTLLPMFAAPAWAPRAVVIFLAAAFLPVLVFSWVYELTPEGLKRESQVDRSASLTQSTGQRIEHVIVVLLALGIAYFAFDKFVLAPRHQAAEVAQARKEGGAEALVNAYGDKSIAVLPFVNMSADKEQEYFADGIAEELLNRLAKVQGLRVIARTSSFSFKGKDADVATIAAALKVAHLLEGSVRRSGNKLRISAKLVRAADGGELWSQTYDREMADVFAMQDEIAGAVVGELELKLLGNGSTAKRSNPEAYALYLQGRQIRFQRSREALEQSLALVQRALALDPGMAEAWTELSLIYRSQADTGIRPNAEGYRLAREAANKALALQPDLTAAHVQLASISRGELDLAASAAHLSRAAETAPEDSDVLRAASRVADSLGRYDAAIAYAEALVARDPQNPASYSLLANTYYAAGRLDDSQAAALQVVKMAPKYITGHDSLSDILAAKGQYEAALAEAKLEDDTVWRRIALAKAYHYLGRKAESDAALAQLIHDNATDAPFNIAYVYALRGEKDKAFEWLERGIKERDPGMSDAATIPYFASLHDDPRWLPFLRRHGFAPEQLAAIKLDVPLPAPAAASP